MGPSGVYTIFQLRGRDVGACCTLQPEQQAHGVPPHWMTYVAVASADDVAAKTAALGGKVIVSAFDVFDLGRMAVIQDPTGAMISVWQARKHTGVGVTKELNAFGWSELNTRDTAAAHKFYTGLFGWETLATDNPAGFSYTHWRVDGTDIGGMMAMDANWPANVPPHWMIYATVANCDESAKKVAELGGRVCVPPTDIPEVGRFAVINDPQGAVFSIIQLTNPKL